MTRYIYSDYIPEEVDYLTAGKRYEIIDSYNFRNYGEFQAAIMDDNGVVIQPVNINWPCAYIDGKIWEYVDEDADN